MEAIFAGLLSKGIPDLGSHLELIRSTDWASTPLGDLNSWPPEVAFIFHVVMIEPQPKLVLLGPDDTMIYNVAYSRWIGENHPKAMGRPFTSVWTGNVTNAEHWFTKIKEDGRAHEESSHNVMVMRNGFLESCYISFSIVPLGPISGHLLSVKDVTEEFVADDRASALGALSGACNEVTNLKSLWQVSLGCFNDQPFHFPFAILFTSRAPANSEQAAKAESCQTYQLRGSAGTFDHPLPETLYPDSAIEPLNRFVREAIVSKEPVLLKVTDGSLPKEMSQASLDRGFGDPCSTAVIVPIRSYASLKVRGFLIIGLSTRRPWNAAYKSWIMEISRTIGESATNSIMSEEGARKEQEAAENLAMREQEASNISGRFQRLMKIMEKSDVGVFECSVDGRLSWANSAWYSLSGYPEDAPSEEFSWMDYVYEEDGDLVMSNWKLMSQGASVTYPLRWKRPGGGGHWVLAMCLPVLDDNGVVTSISGCTTDISAQKQIEQGALKRAEALERARSSEQRFTHFLDNAPMGVSIIEWPSFALSYVNRSWYDLSGYEKVPVDQIDWTKTVAEEDQPVVKRVCDLVVTTRKAEVFQLRMKNMYTAADGKRYRRWVEWTITPEFADDGTTVRTLLACGSNISHLKWAEDLQRIRFEEALEAKRQQENFVDMTSHELRNPLGAVVHCADAISDALAEMSPIAAKTTPTQDRLHLQDLILNSVEAVQTIAACSAHQKRIVDDLLTLSKLDSNLLQINRSAVQASSVLHDVHRMFETEAQRVGVTLTVEEDKSLQGVDWVALDTGRVQQILINLVTNAIKFTKSKERDENRHVKISMGCSTQRPSQHTLPTPVDFTLARGLRDSIHDTGDVSDSTDENFYLWFSVRDSGRGMNETERARLFSRFSQGSTRTYSDYGGSGLGLYISRNLTEMQGGEIGVASELGVGSTFAFFIRTQSAKLSLNRMELPIIPRRSSSRLSMQSGEPGIAVLVTEDNLVNQKVLTKQLTKNGYRVHTADNGQQALDFVKTTRHWDENTDGVELDVILMDIEMPIMDGITATQRIRDLQKAGSIRSHIPIIAVSANARSEQTHQAIVAGMDDSISKPFRIPELLPKIDRLAEWARALDAHGE